MKLEKIDVFDHPLVYTQIIYMYVSNFYVCNSCQMNFPTGTINFCVYCRPHSHLGLVHIPIILSVCAHTASRRRTLAVSVNGTPLPHLPHPQPFIVQDALVTLFKLPQFGTTFLLSHIWHYRSVSQFKTSRKTYISLLCAALTLSGVELDIGGSCWRAGCVILLLLCFCCCCFRVDKNFNE